MELFDKKETLNLRKKHVANNVKLFFDKDPLKIVRGSGQYMFDENGVKYLDCINNVAHVGHCHPHVVQKTTEQMGHLETNSRYLHDNLVNYSKRITAYMPEELNMTFYTNSGSEANDLAIRIARRCGNGGSDIMVLDHAYHGHLTTLIDISPYKFNNTGGEGQQEWVHVAPMPDRYRGMYRDSEYSEEELTDLYVQEVIDLVEKAEHNCRKICLFMVETMQSCGGQVILPVNYLKKVKEYLLSKNILLLADEVQCGFYRNGEKMWGFQLSNTVPDFVTIGKSMGNGHPVACLVTTKYLADSFANYGMQYFNTYGGNPVSMAAANAVLDVIEDEKLHENVNSVSKYLINELKELQKCYQIIGDVRGKGFFIGVDLVTDRITREPATEIAQIILDKMKENGNILLSLDGPYENVLKFKPPLCFNHDNAKFLLSHLENLLRELNL